MPNLLEYQAPIFYKRNYAMHIKQICPELPLEHAFQLAGYLCLGRNSQNHSSGDVLPDSGVPPPVYRYTCTLNDVGVMLIACNGQYPQLILA
jgi:hypothetical protein